MYACKRKGRERNRGDCKTENGCVHHPAGGIAGGAFRRPRLRDGDGGRADARRARARVQPRCDCDIRARYARAADCDNRGNPSARRASANIRARYADTRAADCDIYIIRARYANANIRARYACADCDNSAYRRANIRARYANARADCDNIRANPSARRRADCDSSAYRRANVRVRYARANRDLHADARANIHPASPDARANVNAGSPDCHARAAARRQCQGGQRRRRASARFHAQFRGRNVAHHRESAG